MLMGHHAPAWAPNASSSQKLCAGVVACGKNWFTFPFPYFVSKTAINVGMPSHTPDAPSTHYWVVLSNTIELHRHIHMTVILDGEGKIKRKKMSPREKAQNVGNLGSPECSLFWTLVALLLPHSHPQSTFTQQPAQPIAAAVTADCAASDTEIPSRDRGAGMVKPHRTAALLKLFVFMDRDTEHRLWIVPLRMQNATLKKKREGKKKERKAIQREEKDGNIHHSTAVTKNKSWQQPPMQCLVYANAGCSSVRIRSTTNCLFLCIQQLWSLVTMLTEPIAAFEWERWIAETATLEHIQDCFYKFKTIYKFGLYGLGILFTLLFFR